MLYDTFSDFLPSQNQSVSMIFVRGIILVYCRYTLYKQSILPAATCISKDQAGAFPALQWVWTQLNVMGNPLHKLPAARSSASCPLTLPCTTMSSAGRAEMLSVLLNDPCLQLLTVHQGSPGHLTHRGFRRYFNFLRKMCQ